MKKKERSNFISFTIVILIIIIVLFLVVKSFEYTEKPGNPCNTLWGGKIEIKNNLDYTCYDNITKQMRVQIHFGDIQENSIKNIRILINREGSTYKTYTIDPNNWPIGVSVYKNDTLKKIPAPGEDIIYVLDSDEQPESITIGVTSNIKKVGICPSVDNFNIIKLC